MSDIPCRESLLLPVYRRYLADRSTVGFVREMLRHYTVGTLERLAGYPQPELRGAALFALGLVGDFQVHQVVGRALLDEERGVRLLAAAACRSVWNRCGSDLQRRQLADIIRLNAARQYGDSVAKASALLDDAPGMAEAWYQRGAACLQLEHYARAIADFHQVLELNPYHYVAAVAIGEAYLRLANPYSALDAFRHALRVNPELDEVRASVDTIARQLKDG